MLFPTGLQTTREEENIDTGAIGIDGDIVEVGSVEFAMAVAVAEAEAMDPMSLEEARRRSDWLKWDEAIKVELHTIQSQYLIDM